MTEITRAQFAVAAVVVAVLAWAGGRALAPGAAAVPPAASSTAADRPSRGEPGTGPAGDSADGVSVSRAPAAALVVHVAGAVRRPGVYRLKDGDRIGDAVKRAGGGTAKANLDAVNLAAKARDGVQILIPRKQPGGGVATAAGAGAPAGAGAGAAPAGAVPAAAPGAPAAGAPIDLNTATAEQLDTLDGVGPATAAKILQYRAEHGPFRSVDDLEQIPGIGPKKMAAMRARVRV